MSEPLFVEERRRAIVDQLKKHGRVSVNQLSEALHVSTVTIRQDLRALEDTGMLDRTYGGAVLRTFSSSAAPELSFGIRQNTRSHEKEAIGAAAAKLVKNGYAVALDGSTTAYAIIPHLKQLEKITVVTNSLIVAQGFLDAPHITVLMPGGRLRRDSVGLVGRPEDLPNINLNVGFFGTSGISPEFGVTERDPDEANMKKAMMAYCLVRVVVADASKWGQIAPYTIAKVDSIHRMITTVDAPAEIVRQCQAQGVHVERVVAAEK